jgi:peptide/nickel transport system substrate-binding protein
MKRFIAVLLIALSSLMALSVTTAAQEAPSGTWLGTWPYVLPPDHHLNSFAAGGLNDNLGVVYRPLVELSPAYFLWASNEYVGFLAESWGFSEDNTSYSYTLKADAKWSDGSAVTSQDVLDTYAIGKILGWSQFNYVASIEAVDAQTVKFNFIEGKASYLAERLLLKESIVASANYGELAAEAKAVADSGVAKDDPTWAAISAKIAEFRPETLIASGPYTYTLADVGDAFLTLKWQPNSIYSGTVKFGELKLWAGETESTTPLVLSGELAHSTNVYPPATIDSFVSAGIRLVTTPRGYGPSLLFNYAVAPFDNVLVRRAVAHAINRDQSAFLTNGLGASGTRYFSGILDSMTEQLMSPEGIAALNPYAFDLEGAAALMEEAGYTRNADGKWADASGATISIEYTFPQDFADFSAAAQDATQQLNDFGFDISLRALPWQDARAAIYAGDFALSVWSWGAGSPFAEGHFNNPTIRFNKGGLPPEGQPGIGFPLQFDFEGQAVDLVALKNNVSAGLDAEANKAKADALAKIINTEVQYVPLNEMLSVEPLNEASIGGAPADGDPIYANPSNDHFLIYLILNGTFFPVGQ